MSRQPDARKCRNALEAGGEVTLVCACGLCKARRGWAIVQVQQRECAQAVFEAAVVRSQATELLAMDGGFGRGDVRDFGGVCLAV